MTAMSNAWETRLCDDRGLVSNDVAFQLVGGSPTTYLDIHNRLAQHHAYGSSPALVTEPFACTGSAHFSGIEIRCTSWTHKWNVVKSVNDLPDDGYLHIGGTDA